MSHILRLSPCDDLMEMIGKSVVKRRKELKRIAREKQATVSYWIYHSSDELVVYWVRNHNRKGRSAGDRMFDRTDLINHTLPRRHRLLDEIAGTDKAELREGDLWAIENLPDPALEMNAYENL